MAEQSPIFKAVVYDIPDGDDAALQGVINGQSLIVHAIEKGVVSNLGQAVTILGTMTIAALIHAVDQFCEPEEKDDQFTVVLGWLHGMIENAAADLCDDDVCQKIDLALATSTPPQ